ncbi:MAG: Dyp-type peroxidase [Polyangiales bacterium]
MSTLGRGNTLDRRNIQGNILEGYRFPHVLHLFARIDDPARGAAALGALRPLVMTAVRWTAERPTRALNLGLTHAGLRALGVPDTRLARFPQEFREGMLRRARLLGDDPSHFEPVWQKPEQIHVWLWLHGRSPEDLRQLRRQIEEQVGDSLSWLEPQAGEMLTNADGQAIEHFGFRDGISGPSISGSFTAPRPGDGELSENGTWRPVAAGELLLGHPDESGEIARLADEDTLGDDGTFAVLRKLGQDVHGFRKYTAALAEQHGGVDADWIAARMVGRQRDGTPLVAATQASSSDAHPSNAFRFAADPEGRVCPLGAHIRRANPRDGHAFLGAFARHRIVRRSATFGPPLPESADTEVPPVDRYRQRGLLFVALNAALDRQFEFLQRFYMNEGAAARQGVDADPLVGAHREHSSDFVIPGDMATQRGTIVCPALPRFIECLGGEYFFLPSLRCLERLTRASTTVSQHGRQARAAIHARPSSDAVISNPEITS